MRTFGGEFSRKQKVSLVGKSRTVESREEILEKTRLEREARKQRRLENEMATRIQAGWRSWASREKSKRKFREQWRRDFGDSGQYITAVTTEWELLCGSVGVQGSGKGGHGMNLADCLRRLCYFVEPEEWKDVACFAQVIRVCFERDGQGSNGYSVLLDWASRDLGARMVLVRNLFQIVIACIAAQKHRCKDMLCMSIKEFGFKVARNKGDNFSKVPSDQDECLVVGRTLKQLIDLVIGLVSFQGQDLGIDSELLAEIKKTMFTAKWIPGRRRVGAIFMHIAEILSCCCNEPISGGYSREGPSAAESLATACIVSYISCFGENGSRFSGQQVLPIMGIQCLRSRFPSLMPLQGKLWRMSMIALRQESADDLMPNPTRRVDGQGTSGNNMQVLVENLVLALPIGLSLKGGGDEMGEYCIEFMKFIENACNSSLWCINKSAVVENISSGQTLEALFQNMTTVFHNSIDSKIWPNRISNIHSISTICEFIKCLVECCGDPAQQSRLILVLAIKAKAVKILWRFYLSPGHDSLSIGAHESWIHALTLFSEMLASSILVLGDESLYGRGFPLPIVDFYDSACPKCGVLCILKECLWNILWKSKLNKDMPSAESRMLLSFLKHGGRLLNLLHERNGRRPFAPDEAFYASDLPIGRFKSSSLEFVERNEFEKLHQERDEMDVDENEEEMQLFSGNRLMQVLLYAPPLVPFMERARIFHDLVSKERRNIRDDGSLPGFSLLGAGMPESRFITVHRGRVLEDAFSSLNQRKDQVKKRIQISFVNEFGEVEAGIDGGGVFKEFLECAVKEAIDPRLGLFSSTTDNKLYPSPPRGLKSSQKFYEMLEFVGLMVGKALWEGILLELPLASFFLKKFRGVQSCDLDDLPALDPDLAKNLNFLLSNPDKVDDLELTFTITESINGSSVDVELVKGGASIPVTASNALQFVQRVSDYKLNGQINQSCNAFLKGFHSVIPREWVSLFNDSELQMLIGGAEGEHALDLSDLKAHVRYAGGYSADHPLIMELWEVLSSMSSVEQADFLRFVTSCPRPPLLGFSTLEPPLTIQMAGKEDEHQVDRLPTAATCVNLLKLPPYPGGTGILREKLMYAIRSHSGFDLS